MRIRLNIGLVPNTRPNTFTVRRENAVNGTEYVRRLFPNFLSFATKLRAAEFTAPNGGQVVEETLVFDITVPDCQRNIGGGRNQRNIGTSQNQRIQASLAHRPLVQLVEA